MIQWLTRLMGSMSTKRWATDPLWTKRIAKTKFYRSTVTSSRASLIPSLKLIEDLLSPSKLSIITESPALSLGWICLTNRTEEDPEAESSKKAAHPKVSTRTDYISSMTTKPTSDRPRKRKIWFETKSKEKTPERSKEGTQWCSLQTSPELTL